MTVQNLANLAKKPSQIGSAWLQRETAYMLSLINGKQGQELASLYLRILRLTFHYEFRYCSDPPYSLTFDTNYFVWI